MTESPNKPNRINGKTTDAQAFCLPPQLAATAASD
jgi:hypothetical protein